MDQIKKELTCGICGDVPYELIVPATCSHIFCRTCIELLMYHCSREDKAPSCPMCRVTFKWKLRPYSWEFTTNKYLTSIAEIIHARGDAQCKFGCGAEGPLRDIIEHHKTCPESIVGCDFCINLHKKKDLLTHITSHFLESSTGCNFCDDRDTRVYNVNEYLRHLIGHHNIHSMTTIDTLIPVLVTILRGAPYGDPIPLDGDYATAFNAARDAAFEAVLGRLSIDTNARSEVSPPSPVGRSDRAIYFAFVDMQSPENSG